jgi:hypothetical protein
MIAEDFINHRFADDRSHVFFALTARDLPDNLVIQEVYFSKDSNDQELVIIWALASSSNDDLVRTLSGRPADVLRRQVKKESPAPNDPNSQIVIALRHPHVDDFPILPLKKMKGIGV